MIKQAIQSTEKIMDTSIIAVPLLITLTIRGKNLHNSEHNSAKPLR